MYLDILDEIHVNKKLIRIVGLETSVYWAELVSILKQVVKKHTCDEHGYFKLDRSYVEHETSIKPEVQAICDQTLTHFGVLQVDPNDLDRIVVNVENMIALITDESPELLKQEVAKPKLNKTEAATAKKNGIKFNLKNAVVEPDMDLKKAYDLWVESMVDAANCRFTKAVVNLFVTTLRTYTQDKNAQLRIIEIATIQSYKDASWAINKYEQEKKPFTKKNSLVDRLPQQKIATAVDTSRPF